MRARSRELAKRRGPAPRAAAPALGRPRPPSTPAHGPGQAPRGASGARAAGPGGRGQGSPGAAGGRDSPGREHAPGRTRAGPGGPGATRVRPGQPGLGEAASGGANNDCDEDAVRAAPCACDADSEIHRSGKLQGSAPSSGPCGYRCTHQARRRRFVSRRRARLVAPSRKRRRRLRRRPVDAGHVRRAGPDPAGGHARPGQRPGPLYPGSSGAVLGAGLAHLAGLWSDSRGDGSGPHVGCRDPAFLTRSHLTAHECRGLVPRHLGRWALAEHERRNDVEEPGFSPG